MKVLAISTPVERVFISPKTIPNQTVAEYVETLVKDIKDEVEKKQTRTELLAKFENAGITVKEDIATELSAALGVSKEMILEKAAKENRADETIKKQVELELTEKLEQLRALWMGAKIAVVKTDDEGIGVDTPEDAERVEKMLLERMA